MEDETTLVLGVGNTLLTDEGVGVHVINHLPPHILTIPGSVLSTVAPSALLWLNYWLRTDGLL